MSYVIDLAAERREITYPDGIPVRFTEKLDLYFPAELPADALDPILSDELDLVGLIGDIFNSTDGDSDAGVAEIVAALFRRPTLPRKFLGAVRETYRILLDAQLEGQHHAFLAAKPSLSDYVRLTTGLAKVYGVELGKLFKSPASSESDGATSNPTSPATTESTPDASGFVPDNPDSLGYGG
ncbi:hypothetical protein ABTY59_31755 [Streptomyces sp. NPDC096079]|uniref:hypothetical protein n=1 Tax=Streptomyces sp. NPDC096079 TaxID=3155820 RepID=UPI00331746BD